MTDREIVARANAILKEKIFPTLRELAQGKNVKMSEDDQVMRNMLLVARIRLEELAEAENLELLGTEVIAYPELVAPGQVVVNVMAVTKDEADAIRGALAERDLGRHSMSARTEKDDELPN